MAEIQPQAPIAASLLELLVEQYKNAGVLRSMIEIEAAGLDEVEGVFLDIKDSFWLADATGEQLDYVGALWNVPRGVLGDAAYRALIYATSLQGSTVTPDDLVKLIRNSYGATYVEYFKETTACFFVRLVNNTRTLPQAQLEQYCPAGVLGIIGQYLVTEVGTEIVDYAGNNIMCSGAQGNIPTELLLDGSRLLDGTWSLAGYET